MKLKNLFYLLLALPLAFAACETESDDVNKTPEVKEPVLKLTSNAEVDVTAAGGEFEITYTLENKKEGVELTATCEADWVSVTAGDKVKVVIEANEGEAREAKVVVAYEAQKFEVTYKQAAKEQGEKPEDPEKPVLTLTSAATLEFTAEGGDGEITYTLENAVEGVELAATCEATWVTELKAEEKVTFKVAANEGEARETKVVVAYGELNFEVAVKQAKKAEPVVPGEPTAFVPKKVTASHSNMEAGNFVLNLYVDDTNRHEFDMYDEVSPNDNYLTPGKYTTEDESIKLKYSKFYNGSERIAMASAELDITLNEEDWTFTIKGAFESVEGAKHTIDWTGSIEGFVDPNAPEEFPFSTKEGEIVRASTDDGLTWTLVFFENNQTMGNPMTRIVVQLDEINTMHITDGTYTLADGGIVESVGASGNGSFYRYSREADGGAMTECELTVAIDKENETAKLSGYFVAAAKTITFEWNGAVQGFIYKELGEEGITQWDKFILRNQYSDCKVLYGYTNGNLETPFVDFSLFKLGGKKSDPVAAGIYPVGDWEYTTTHDRCANDAGGINGKHLASGEVVIEIVPEGYKVSFDVVDELGNPWKGTYIGELPFEPYKEE